MPSRSGPVHVVTTTRPYKGRVYSTHLLRRSFREDGKVKNETLGNLSHLPDSLIDIIRRALRGEAFVPAGERFEIVASQPHGDTAAVLRAMRRLEVAGLLGGRPCREADLVMAMIAARIVAPHTKLATTRWWGTATLAEDSPWPMPARTSSTAPWTGCSPGRTRSSRSWPSGTSPRAAWRCTT